MKMSMQQLVIVVCIVVAFVFIATYVSITIGGRGGSPKGPVLPEAPNDALVFLEKTPMGMVEGKPIPKEQIAEVHTPGHYDFWFHNTSGKEVALSLHQRGCKCTGLEMCLLPFEAENLTKAEIDSRAAKEALEWKPMERDAKPYTVPPGKSGGIRMSWNGKLVGPERLWAELQADPKSGYGPPIRLEAAVVHVNPVMFLLIDPNPTKDREGSEAHLGSFGAGTSKTAKFLCWSATRDEFEMTPIPSPDPCVTHSTPVKLTAEECQQFSKDYRVTMRTGYRMNVTVQERNDAGQQMELGVFRRRVQVKSPLMPEPAQAVVSGIVRGEITVGTAEDRDQINLSFPASQGTTAPVRITPAVEGDIKLAVAEEKDLADRKEKAPAYPEFMEKPTLAEMQAAAGKAWTLTVTVPPNALHGAIPRESAIYLKVTVNDRPPRLLRIPVTGNGYTR